MSIVKLTESQLNKKISIIDEYKSSSNAASASAVDANANVEQKNIATLEAEINKDINIQINREMLRRKIKELFGEDLANEYIRQLESHEIYCHDESSLKPYTYGASEAIVVYKNNKKILTTFENIYSLYSNLKEEILDEKNGVWAKYPNDLYIDSYNGKTKITRLVKKERHRDLLRVKTKYGEDIIVTDNHPMIIGDNVNNTVEAKDSLNKKQYKSKIEFNSDIKEFDTKVLFEDNCFTDYGSFYMSNINDNKKVEGIRKTIKLSDKLGYVVGFFIAEGCYEVNGVIVVQNDETILKKIASYLYEETGIISKIYKDVCPSHSDRNTKYILRISSGIFKNLLTNYFQIKSYAENKSLPINIFETNKDFVNGVVSGIIDGDGSIGSSAISIRVASRSLITQLSIILKSFNVGFSNSYQEQKNQFMGSFSSNYPIFGVLFSLTGDLDFNLSEKVTNFKEKLTNSTRYIKDKTIIKSIKIIKNNAFLDNFIYDITTENNEFICNNIRVHNCTSISLYPFLMDGLTKLGGESKAPQHLNSFCGNFVNLIFAVSSQFAGAVATVEFLNVFDYYARKDYGDNYLETHQKLIDNHLQHVVYAINQPAAARGYQSVFWNISIFDKEYFDSMFGEFVFPDFTKPSWNSLERLQEHFMKWFNVERTKAVLTFPVITAAILTKNGKPKDEKFARMCAKEMSEGNSFFVYMSDNADSLASCCRLRNEFQDSVQQYAKKDIVIQLLDNSYLELDYDEKIKIKYNNEIIEIFAKELKNYDLNDVDILNG